MVLRFYSCLLRIRFTRWSGGIFWIRTNYTDSFIMGNFRTFRWHRQFVIWWFDITIISIFLWWIDLMTPVRNTITNRIRMTFDLFLFFFYRRLKNELFYRAMKIFNKTFKFSYNATNMLMTNSSKLLSKYLNALHKPR